MEQKEKKKLCTSDYNNSDLWKFSHIKMSRERKKNSHNPDFIQIYYCCSHYHPLYNSYVMLQVKSNEMETKKKYKNNIQPLFFFFILMQVCIQSIKWKHISKYVWNILWEIIISNYEYINIFYFFTWLRLKWNKIYMKRKKKKREEKNISYE